MEAVANSKTVILAARSDLLNSPCGLPIDMWRRAME
jgi:hypothetical protein